MLPFTWGKTAAKAVYNSAVLEACAQMAYLALSINPERSSSQRRPHPQTLRTKARQKCLLWPGKLSIFAILTFPHSPYERNHF